MTTEKEIAAHLGETGAALRAQISRILARCGEALANTILQETLALERGGGMMTKDGKQRRTACGGNSYIKCSSTTRASASRP